MIDIALAFEQLARCTLECNGCHTALAAAAAAVWIVLPAAQLHTRFEKPLGEFLRLQCRALFSLGITADNCKHQVPQECPQNPDECGSWLLQKLEAGKNNCGVPAMSRANVDITQLGKVWNSLLLETAKLVLIYAIRACVGGHIQNIACNACFRLSCICVLSGTG